MVEKKTVGPKAPRDPHKRSCIYIMLDQKIQSVEQSNGNHRSEIYLDGERLINKAEIIGEVKDNNILSMLSNCEGFYKLVHSIGVTINNGDKPHNIQFGLKNYSKTDKYKGSVFETSCLNNGAEYILDISRVIYGENDNVVGQLYFDFGRKSSTITVTVKLYLNDGYQISDLKVDSPVEWDSERMQEVIKKSLVQTGNTQRIKKAIKKAQEGEEVTIAFIGGSITQGAGAVPIHTECYAYKAYEYFKEMFCVYPENCKFIKAGIGGTSSELGLIRYDKDVESSGREKPDIVIVEFAVNDEGDETKGACHESLIYRILKKENKPAVIMLFSVFANDWNLQNRLQIIGETYDLPMVSLSDALVEQFNNTEDKTAVITKRQYFYDIYHPTNNGHKIMALCLKNLFVTIEQTPESNRDIDLENGAAISRDYENIHFFDRGTIQQIDCDNNSTWSIPQVLEIGGFTNQDKALQCVERNKDTLQTPQFTNNWMHEIGNIAEPFVMKVYAKAVFIVVKDSDDFRFGKADIHVDDKPVLTYDTRKEGWNHCNARLLFSHSAAKEHIVKVTMAEGNGGNRFTILGFGIVE